MTSYHWSLDGADTQSSVLSPQHWSEAMALAAVLFDLGDTIMDEATEEKVGGVTRRAGLVPGMAALLRDLRRAGLPLGLVADTRAGTYRNVLRQYGLYDLFGAFAVSDELGVEKPDRRIFLHALGALGLAPPDRSRVAMVGNNLARDIRGANALGLIGVWLRWNDRYPGEPARDTDRLRYRATPANSARKTPDQH